MNSVFMFNLIILSYVDKRNFLKFFLWNSNWRSVWSYVVCASVFRSIHRRHIYPYWTSNKQSFHQLKSVFVITNSTTNVVCIFWFYRYRAGKCSRLLIGNRSCALNERNYPTTLHTHLLARKRNVLNEVSWRKKFLCFYQEISLPC